MNILLKPIKTKKVSDQAYEQIRDLIFRGQLKPGDQIMPERELALALGVSRPTVREAIKKLVTMGLLEHRQGQGTFVSSVNSQREHNPLAAVIEGHDASLEELLEVRMGLEGQSTILAAQRATTEDIRILEEALQAMLAENLAGRLGIEEDVAFHMAIAFASKNPVQVHIMKSFHDLLHFGIKENLKALWEEPASLPTIRRHHQAIFEAVKNHDPAAGYQAMTEHIGFVLDFVRQRRTRSHLAGPDGLDQQTNLPKNRPMETKK